MKNLSLPELLKSVLRRPLWFALPVVVMVGLAFGALRTIVPIYRASTLIMVEPQKVPADYVKATVTSTMEERLKTIQQQITNRDNLERIIRETGLYPDLRLAGGAIHDDAIQQARRDLAVETQGTTVFRVYFQSPDPEKAAATANRVAELFITGNLALREKQAEGTSSFLDAELGETKRKLEAQEAKMASFKRYYMGELPEQRETNLRAIEQLQSKLQINLDALDKAELRRMSIQREIAAYRPPQQQSVLAGPTGPTRREQLRAELIALRAQYTDRHPEVVRKLQEIEALERAGEEPPPPPPAVAAQPAQVVDPVLRSQLAAVEDEIRRLVGERERIQADSSRLQGRLENTPGVEQQLLSLTRDYENIQGSYQSLLNKRIEARLAENLEKRRQSEQFTILERAIPPGEPYYPQPTLFLALGLAAGGLLGLGLALLREHTDQTYTDVEQLQHAFAGVPVLATIPQLGRGAEPRARRRR
ncbi:MAG TPA: GNVR domain-containing protein [Thermoanaerobaculia bacterium]|nr:GNVR domain-containing protein [Thermoanaerobaculia bacterium]